MHKMTNRQVGKFTAMFFFVALTAATVCGATVKVPLKTGWKFAKADDPKYVCDASMSNEVMKLSSILDRAERGDLSDTIDFDWAKPSFDDSAWQDVRVPHDWGVDEPFDYDRAFYDAFLDVTGVGWYRIKFRVESGKLKIGDDIVALPPDGKVYFECDGAMSYAMLYLDGKFLGGWPYGYTRWRVVLTNGIDQGLFALPDGEHVIAIRCHNIPDSSSWYTGAGLYRNCRLLVCPKDHVVPGSVFITTPEVTAKYAKVCVRYTMSESGPREFSFKVENPRLWDIDDPYLYTVCVEGDQHRYGIRTISFNADERRFQLNGRTVPLNGVAMHHDLGAIGAAWNRTAQKRRLMLFKEAGVNAIRSSHNPPAEGLLELCDEMGFLVFDESFHEWRIRGPGKRVNGYTNIFDTWHERDVRAWIRTDRNHPCVIMYSIGNEVFDVRPVAKGRTDGVATARELASIVAEEDSTRPSCNANNETINYTNDYPRTLSVMGCNYFSWMYPALVEKYPDVPFFGTETICMGTTRGFYRFPVHWKRHADFLQDLHISSYCSEASGWYDISAGWACPPDVQWYWMDKVKTCMGEFIWSGIDYLGGPSDMDDIRKKPNFSDLARQAKALLELKEQGKMRAAMHTCVPGFLDLAGFKKDAFWLFQSRWRPDFPMAHILPHWNWKGREGEITPVYVFTSGDEGELFLNGRSLGRQKKLPGVWDRAYRLRWDEVRYEPGTLEVVTYKGGKEWARDVVKTTGPAVRLSAAVERGEIHSDGEDLCYVNVCVKDTNGLVVSDACPDVEFSVEGPAELVATDNGDETDFEWLRSPHRKVFNGWVQAIVRPKTGTKGVVRVSSKSEGLEGAFVTFIAK